MNDAEKHSRLIRLLEAIEQNDTNYEVRSTLVFEALAAAFELKLEAGIRIDPSCDPSWVVVQIELPVPNGGQISWHVPTVETDYDGHSTAEKYDRIRRYRLSRERLPH
ncbi:Hypothetical protein UVM_LOCUS423 [uncultured virus]|nr:Hypothetical protein UVM_LOCUS423 [uncultured virus]